MFVYIVPLTHLPSIYTSLRTMNVFEDENLKKMIYWSLLSFNSVRAVLPNFQPTTMKIEQNKKQQPHSHFAQLILRLTTLSPSLFFFFRWIKTKRFVRIAENGRNTRKNDCDREKAFFKLFQTFNNENTDTPYLEK